MEQFMPSLKLKNKKQEKDNLQLIFVLGDSFVASL